MAILLVVLLSSGEIVLGFRVRTESHCVFWLVTLALSFFVSFLVGYVSLHFYSKVIKLRSQGITPHIRKFRRIALTEFLTNWLNGRTHQLNVQPDWLNERTH